MVCYRKHGHNEGDEPRYTQPTLYGLIAKHKNPRELYLDQLLASGKIETALANEMIEAFKQLLSDRFNNVRQKEIPERARGPHKDWEGMEFSKENSFDASPSTGVSLANLDLIAKAINNVPAGMEIVKKAQKVLDDRAALYSNDKLDWPALPDPISKILRAFLSPKSFLIQFENLLKIIL